MAPGVVQRLRHPVGDDAEAPGIAYRDSPTVQRARARAGAVRAREPRPRSRPRLGIPSRASSASTSGPHTPSVVSPALRSKSLNADLGQRTEDGVDPTGVETQLPEPTLELADVVAALHRRAQVEKSVAEAIAGFDQGGPRRAVAHAGDLEPALVLERSHGLLGRGPVRAGLGRRPGQPAGQSMLQVADGFTGAALSQRELIHGAPLRQGEGRRGRGSEKGVQLLDELSLALGADDACRLLAIAKNDECRDAHH